MSDAKRLTDRVWQIIEKNELDKLGEVIDGDCHFKMPGMEFRGVAALQQALGAYLVAFPDLKHQVHNHVESGDTIALELTVTGTNTGAMQMPQGKVPASGQKVVWESCDYVRVKGGKIVSWHVYHDAVPFLMALHLIHPAH